MRTLLGILFSVGISQIFGCALISIKDFSGGGELSAEVPDVVPTMTLHTSGPLGGPFGKWGDLPPLLHWEYEAGPFHPVLKVRDPSQSYQSVIVERVVAEFPDKTTRVHNESRKLEFQNAESNGEFVSQGEVRLSPAVWTHHAIQINCFGRTIKKDGTEIPFHWRFRFKPETQQYIVDWMSWCASV